MGIIFLLCNFENKWVLKLHQLPKLRLYKNIKQNYNMENYISMNIPKSHRFFNLDAELSQLELKRVDIWGTSI